MRAVGAGLSKKKNGGCCFYFPHFLTVCKPRTCTYHSSQVEVNPLCSFLPVWSTVQINYLFIMSYSGPRCIWVHAFSNTSCFSYVLLSQLFFLLELLCSQMELCASDRRSIKKNNFFTINKAGKMNPLKAGILLKHEKKGLIDSVWKTHSSRPCHYL